MGNINSINKVNFEFIKKNISNDEYIIINTLQENNQNILIFNTLSSEDEIKYLNSYIKNDKNKKIIIYGENCNDNNIIKKYNQLEKLGFYNLYIYIGGLFEWLLLNEIYGEDNFPIINKNNEFIIDILKYKG
tara:strand:- start:3759 stop:4154 length:396 start_codon:yes stop_codon:yes gene_type:complete